MTNEQLDKYKKCINKKYRHYKNKKIYTFLNVGILRSSAIFMAIYKCDEDDAIFIRPVEEFFGYVGDEQMTTLRYYPYINFEFEDCSVVDYNF